MDITEKISSIVRMVVDLNLHDIATPDNLRNVARQFLKLRSDHTDQEIAHTLANEYIRQANLDAVEKTLKAAFKTSMALQTIADLFKNELKGTYDPNEIPNENPPAGGMQAVFSILQSLHTRTSELERRLVFASQ